MKKIALLTLLACGLCSFPGTAEAQILKKIGKKIEKSVERRVERKVDQGIEKGLDKAEDETGNAVEGALASDKEGNKSATKQSEFKTLPDDYQIAITGSGPDLYMEYRMHVDGAQMNGQQMNMSMKMYTSPKTGKGRAETVMEIPMLGEMKMSVLTDMNNPQRAVMLNDKKQQYSVIDFSDSKLKDDKEIYTVNKLGTVNFRGLNCIHAEAINQDGERFEIWTTREIPGYQDIAALYSKAQRMGSDNMWQALQDADCAGFMVKLKVESDGATSIMELVEMQNTDVPASTFEIPDGYKEKKGSMFGGFMN